MARAVRRRSVCMATKHHVRLVDVDALAAVLDVPSHVILGMFRDGRLPGYQISRRRIRFDVAECIAALRQTTATAPDVAPVREGR